MKKCMVLFLFVSMCAHFSTQCMEDQLALQSAHIRSCAFACCCAPICAGLSTCLKPITILTQPMIHAMRAARIEDVIDERTLEDGTIEQKNSYTIRNALTCGAYARVNNRCDAADMAHLTCVIPYSMTLCKCRPFAVLSPKLAACMLFTETTAFCALPWCHVIYDAVMPEEPEDLAMHR